MRPAGLSLPTALLFLTLLPACATSRHRPSAPAPERAAVQPPPAAGSVSWYHPHALPPPPPPPDLAVLLPVETEVRARVLGPIAEVEVVQHYRNEASFPVTIGYTFPLPEGAAVRDVEMVVGDRVIRGEIEEIATARRIYDDARTAGEGALLVTGLRENVFRAEIANVRPQETLAVRLVYAEMVPWEAGAYRLLFPTVVAPRYCPADQYALRYDDPPYILPELAEASFHVTVDLAPGAPLAEVSSPTHPIAIETLDPSDGREPAITRVRLARSAEIANRDVVIRWRPADDALRATLYTGAADEDGTPFALVAYPYRTPNEPSPPREVTVILDSSGSMEGEKFAAATRAVRGLLRGLGSLDTFRLVEFDNDFSSFSTLPCLFGQESLDAADRWLAGVRADGGTEILQPVSWILRQPPDPKRERIVVVITDGQVTNEQQVLDEVRQNLGSARIFTLGIDFAVNDAMLRGMARAGHGVCLLTTPEEDVEGAILSLARRFAETPVTGVCIEGTACVTFPASIPDLFVGDPLIVVGRLAGDVPSRLEIQGRQGDVPWSCPLAPVPVDAAWTDLAAVVADREIQDVLDRSHRVGPAIDRDRVVKLSRTHHIASPYTAFILVEYRKDPEDEMAPLVEVPVAAPYGWAPSQVQSSRYEINTRRTPPDQQASLEWLARETQAASLPSPEAQPMFGAPLNRDITVGRGGTDIGMGQLVPCLPNNPRIGPNNTVGTDDIPARLMNVLNGFGTPVSPGPDAGSGAPLPPTREGSAYPLVLRYLAREQQASGMWQAGGADDVRTTALALIALVGSYPEFRAACDRGFATLAATNLVGLDGVSRALALFALEEGARLGIEPCRAMLDAQGAVLAPSEAGDLAVLARSSAADDLAQLVVATASLAGHEGLRLRAMAACRLLAAADREGPDAGAVRLPGVDPVAASALAAALGR